MSLDTEGIVEGKQSTEDGERSAQGDSEVTPWTVLVHIHYNIFHAVALAF